MEPSAPALDSPATRDGVPSFRIGRRGDEVIAEWVGVATLRATLSDQTSELFVQPGLDALEVKRLDVHIAALLRHLQAGHAPRVQRRAVRRRVAFGDSGAGKSTLAAQLCRDPEVEFFSDDATSLHFESPVVPELIRVRPLILFAETSPTPSA